MADETDVLLKFCEQQWIEAKQAEDQRATFTNIVVLVAGGAFAFIAQKGFSYDSIPLCLLTVVLGIFGAIASQKFYERHQFHIARLKAWRSRIDGLKPDAKLDATKTIAVEDHVKLFPRLNRFRLHRIWFILHGIIASAGIVATILCLVLVQKEPGTKVNVTQENPVNRIEFK